MSEERLEARLARIDTLITRMEEILDAFAEPDPPRVHGAPRLVVISRPPCPACRDGECPTHLEPRRTWERPTDEY